MGAHHRVPSPCSRSDRRLPLHGLEIEGVREQNREHVLPLHHALLVDQEDHHVAELDERLTAHAAGRTGLRRVAHDHDGLEVSGTVCNRGRESATLGTHRDRVSRALDVATRVHVAPRVQQSRAHMEARGWAEGVVPSNTSHRDHPIHVLPTGHPKPPLAPDPHIRACKSQRKDSIF